nr:hypothetical protein [uncultured Arsenicibacter sp.]
MIFADEKVRKAVYAALTTVPLTVAGKTVGVFDTLATAGTAPPYVILDAQQNIPDKYTKDSYIYDHVLTLRIVSTAKAASGRDLNEKVLGELTPRLTPETPSGPAPFTIDGWKIRNVTLTGSDMPEMAAGDGLNVYQKVLTLTINIYK